MGSGVDVLLVVFISCSFDLSDLSGSASATAVAATVVSGFGEPSSIEVLVSGTSERLAFNNASNVSASSFSVLLGILGSRAESSSSDFS